MCSPQLPPGGQASPAGPLGILGPWGGGAGGVCLLQQPAVLPQRVCLLGVGGKAGAALKACGWALAGSCRKAAWWVRARSLFLVTPVCVVFQDGGGLNVAGIGAEKLLPQIPTSFYSSLKTAFLLSSKEPFFPLSYAPDTGSVLPLSVLCVVLLTTFVNTIALFSFVVN